MKRLAIVLAFCAALATGAEARQNFFPLSGNVKFAPSTAAVASQGGGGGGGFDLTIDTVAFGSTASNHFLDINYTFTSGVDGVCAVAAGKDGGSITAATLAGQNMHMVARSIRDTGYLMVAIFCSTANPSGTQEIEILKPGTDTPMIGAVIGFKGMAQANAFDFNYARSTGIASDVTTTATSLSTGCANTVLKNILISGVATYAEVDMTPASGDTQLMQLDRNGMTLQVNFENASGGTVTMGSSWGSGERTEMAVAEVVDDPSESP